MAEGSYEYECMRAELLGINPPNRETFDQQKAEQLRNEVEQDNLDTEELKKIDTDDEQINETAGKIDELNSILSLTQQKLNKFKRTCGSLTSLIKFRQTPTSSAAGSNENLADTRDADALNRALDTLDAMQEGEKETNVQVMKKGSVDMQQKFSSQINKLDSMLRKTESAANALESQNKQIKKMMD